MSAILIVDDERCMRELFRSLLQCEGYQVTAARNGDDALAKIADESFDLVLLDVMMPGRNGFSTCAEIRKRDALLPVIFLTAVEDEASQVRGLGLGADDYIKKTVGEAELLARVRRALERSASIRAMGSAESRKARIGRCTVDLDRRTISCDGVETERLTATENDLLKLLLGGRGRFFSYDEIAAALRGDGFSLESATVRSHMSHLKLKLHEAGDMIVNERFAGYKLLA